METLEATEQSSAAENVLSEVSKPRDGFWVVVASIVTLALIACAAVAHGWRKGYVLAPTDALQLVAPWHEGTETYVARNEQLLDQTVQFVPWNIYAVERLKAGQIPLWNPHSQLGAPFVGNGQSAVFYPTTLLHWHLPAEWSWTISAALRLFVAGLGVYLLAGRYGLRGLPRLLPAIAFMLCGFNVVWLNHPQMNVMPLLPWAVMITEMFVDRVTLWRVLGGAVIFAVQFLGGHPASCIHLLLTCGLVWLFRVIVRPRRVLSGGALAISVAFGFALAAAQWLPLIEYAKHSGAAIVRQEKLASAPLIGLDARYLIGLVFPYASGHPDGVAPFEMRRVTHLPNTNELAPGFVGTVPLVFACYGAVVMRRRREALAWTIIGLIAAAIATKLPGVDHLVRKVPGLNVAQNARLLVVTALALALLAGFGLEGLIASVRAGVEPARLRKWLFRIAAAVAVVAVVLCVGLWIGKSWILNRGYAAAETAYKADQRHENTLDAVKAIVPRVHLELVLTGARLLIPAGMLALMALLLRRRSHRGLGAGLLALTVFDLLGFAIPFNPGSKLDTYFPRDVQAIEKLQELPPARIAGTFRTFFPETSTAYGLSDIRGYDALAPERYFKWWDHEKIGDLPEAMQGYPSRLENPEHPAWSLLNFGYLMTAPQADGPPPGLFKPVYNGDDAAIYQSMDVRPRAWVAQRAEVFETIEPVLDRVAKMDFKPDQVVLLDKDVADDVRPLLSDSTWRSSASTGRRPTTVEIVPAVEAKNERSELVRLKVTNPSGGYLVLADTYFAGWSATIFDGDSARGKDVPILPAYGVLRAVPLPVDSGTIRVEFQYRPWSWRIGAGVSMAAVCLLLVLIGAALCWPDSRPRRVTYGE